MLLYIFQFVYIIVMVLYKHSAMEFYPLFISEKTVAYKPLQPNCIQSKNISIYI